jgi:hypothetical protein
MIALRIIASLVVTLLICIVPLASRANVTSARASNAWIFAADIHLDPTGRYGHGTYGTDSNPALLRSAIRAMQRVDPAPPVVVIGGDFLAHTFDAKRALPTMRSIAQQFDRAFPDAQFVLVLGNEDSNCGDYRVSAGSTFLRAVATAWAPLVNRHGAAPDFVRTFSRDGFYVARLPLAGVRAVGIDDVFWSPRYRNACDGTPHAAAQTLSDLNTVLRRAPHLRSWVFLHIPPGIDAFSTSHITRGLIVIPFLDQRPKDAFVQSVAEPSHDVRLIVAAHTHKFAFRIAGDGGNAIPMLLVPSISPIFRNAPSFLTVRINAAGAIVRADDWTELGGRWADRGGLASLGMPDVSVRSILALQGRLASNPALRERFARLYNGDAPPEITSKNWRVYWCAATDLSATAFRACMAEGGFSIVTARGIKAIAVGVAILALLAAAIVWLVRAAQKQSRRRRERMAP